MYHSTMGQSIVMNNKAFCNLFRNSQKSFHTSPVIFFVNAVVDFEECFTASIIRAGRFRTGVKILFVDYQIN